MSSFVREKRNIPRANRESRKVANFGREERNKQILVNGVKKNSKSNRRLENEFKFREKQNKFSFLTRLRAK